MKAFCKHFLSLKFKTFLFFILLLFLLFSIYKYNDIEDYEFHKLSENSIAIQKECLKHFLRIFKKNKVPMILFDIQILPELFQARPPSWHKSDHGCKTLCKYHPEDKNLITFAVSFTQLTGKLLSIVKDLDLVQFTHHITYHPDPRLSARSPEHYIPTYIWLAYQDHVIHVTVLHDRTNDYVWAGPVTDKDWHDTVEALQPALTGGWHSMDGIKLEFPRYAHAFDKSQRFLGLPLDIDGHRLNVPYHINKFLAEYRSSHFIECDRVGAQTYKKIHEKSLTKKDIKFKSDATKLILKAKQVLDHLEIPFWLSSGTCLGYLRQCDVIPHSVDVDFGIFADDFQQLIIPRMESEGLILTHKFGSHNDSLELSFTSEDQIKLDLFFFYKTKDYYWNGGTRAYDGRKYIYKFQPFDLCWTEFKGMKLRVPCDTQTYIEANYGTDWRVPKKGWVWNADPPNVETNGFWAENELDEMVQVYEVDKIIEDKDERRVIEKLVNDPAFMGLNV